MKKIDAHIHFYGNHPDVVAFMERMDLKFLNICVVHSADETWREQADVFRGLAAQRPDRYAWCTSFDLPDFDDVDYADRVIAGLEKDFQAGAIACKIWKNVGMDLKKPSGEFLMADDAVFDPIYEYLAKSGVPLIAHLAEPLACWQPLSEDDPHYGYYSKNPQWHMYNRPEFPSHGEIMDARDRMLGKHPKLRVVGAHLGSLEYDVAEVAKRLDRYPNFAVDTSARLADLAYQDSEAVRAFMMAYSDRVLFGTDIVQRQRVSEMADDERQRRLLWAESQYRMADAYYGSDGEVTVRNRTVQGLGLPEDVLEKLYFRNAEAWLPGV